jgi:single-stranded-DNA-specific exonuclease
MKKLWHMQQPDPETVTRLSKSLHCHPITAALLVNRNIISEKDALEFLNVSLKDIRSPFALKDMEAAVSRIYSAVTENESILIFGDYDVDGITATAILLDFLGSIGANVSAYIPHRLKEGYGLQVIHITRMARPNKIDLIITADCGSTNHEAAAKARDVGIDVIITDHHNISEKIPPACAVINPKRHDCTAGLQDLAGVGVAFYLLISLRKYLRDRNFWNNHNEPNLKQFCDLVALGTVADMVPLVHENRIFSKAGLQLINSNHRTGITALREAARITNQTAGADDIAFRLAPRLNAAGRMQHASIAVDLLTTENPELAAQIAQSLDGFNQARQDLEQKIIDNITDLLAKQPQLLDKKTLVLWHRQWHEGVLGIVASRMVAKHHRPVVLIAVKESICKGSARSIPGVNLYERLLECSDVLEKFGGHEMAAGLSLKAANLESFQNRFEDIVGRQLEPDDLMPKIVIDQELNFMDISESLIDEIESLAPFGAGNPEPVFMARNVTVTSSKIVGSNHRRMVLTQRQNPAGKVINAIHFNVDTEQPVSNTFEKIAFKIRWNRWRGTKTAQLVIEDFEI